VEGSGLAFHDKWIPHYGIRSLVYSIYKRKIAELEMSSWLPPPRKIVANPTLTIRHPNNGFFSTCSIILHYTVEYFNRYRKLPETINTTDAFNWYRPGTMDSFFTLDARKITYRGPVLY